MASTINHCRLWFNMPPWCQATLAIASGSGTSSTSTSIMKASLSTKAKQLFEYGSISCGGGLMPLSMSMMQTRRSISFLRYETIGCLNHISNVPNNRFIRNHRTARWCPLNTTKFFDNGCRKRNFFTDPRCRLKSQVLQPQTILPNTEQTTSESPKNDIDPFNLVRNDLDNLYLDIKEELRTSMPELEEISTYYFDGQGKALRPLIVILIARALNHHVTGNPELLPSQKRVSLLIEMIHTASLIHDDVIDSADTRRGKPSVNVLWGQKKSIFAGDFIISKGSQMLARLNSTVVISILTEAIIDLVLGEFMQMGSKENEDERFAHYIQKTFKKTASLIAYTCKAVVYLSGANEELQEAAFQYGRNLGIAFQLVDDLLDFVSNQAELGKPAANDLHLGLATAPVLFASEKFPELNEMIVRRFSEPGDAEKAYEAVMKSDGIHHTRMLAKQHTDEAIRHISCLVDTPEKQALLSLCDIVLNRKK